MSRDNPFSISPYIIGSWEDEIRTGTPEQLAETADLCDYQRRGWMATARSTKAAGARPFTEVNMAWKYHRHLMMLTRAMKQAEAQNPIQASLF